MLKGVSEDLCSIVFVFAGGFLFSWLSLDVVFVNSYLVGWKLIDFILMEINIYSFLTYFVKMASSKLVDLLIRSCLKKTLIIEL